MSKEICISSTPHETRLAIVEDEQLTEVYYERENEYTLAGSIYKGRVTRVLPGMQSAFVDVGLERDAFLYVTDFLDEQEDSAEFERVPANGGGREERERSGRQQTGPDNREARAPRSRETATPPEAASETAAAPNEEFAEGTRRWRGRRGRRGGGSRPQPAQEPTQSYGGEEPSDAVEPAEHAAQEASPQRSASAFSLPGESLSKYGIQSPAKDNRPVGEVRESQPKPTYIPSKPSTLIETPLEWNGSGLLPGETLSRYRGATEPAPARAPQVVPTAEPVFEAQAEPVEETEFSEQETVDIAIAEPETESVAVPAADLYVTAIEEQEEQVRDYEPEDASASYRVDPSAPSEYRIATPASEDAAQESEEEIFPEIPEIERSLRPMDPIEPMQPLDSPQPQGGSLAGDLSITEEDEDDESNEEDLDDTEQGLYASAGLLEEEEVGEEEEYDFTPIHNAQEDHDLEDMEEETLDRQVTGAEIGELVREEHVNRTVHADASGIEIEEEADEADEEETDEVAADGEAETQPEGAPAAGGQTPHRGRQEQRRGGRGGRPIGRRRHNGRRQSAQTSDLPIISELLKQGQEILVQIAKEPIAKKGARITSHIALPGRFLVFMPTVNHVGVSRKISSEEERQRLKRILNSEKGDGGGGFIVRTAADGASEDDLRADIRFLISLWNEIKQRADDAKAPALIYHDLNLVERILRDQVSDNFSSIWVDNEAEYERIVRFLNRFQPSLVRRVKLYTKETPLFEQFGIQEEIGKALKSKVWLKSGGSIVINQTEALVAIDINTGKYVGKTARLEDTILKTNLDAIPEIVRQIRLRDLGGIIVIDFIDMDERKNRHKVMQALEEALKADRAPSKVLQFNDFGLVAITRKRVKQSLERTLCVQCSICSGTGMTKSPATVCNEIYVEMRKMQRHLEGRDVLLRVHPDVVKTLKGNNGRWLAELEEMAGKTIIVKSDPALPPEQFDIH